MKQTEDPHRQRLEARRREQFGDGKFQQDDAVQPTPASQSVGSSIGNAILPSNPHGPAPATRPASNASASICSSAAPTITHAIGSVRTS